MKVKVMLNNLRTAPRKTRMVADLVRGKKVADARSILSFTVNKTAGNILKLLNSAVATATHDLHLEESNLLVSEIFVGEGPKLKRWHAMSRGRGYPIEKKTSHITLVLSEINLKAAEPEKKPAQSPAGNEAGKKLKKKVVRKKKK